MTDTERIAEAAARRAVRAALERLAHFPMTSTAAQSALATLDQPQTREVVDPPTFNPSLFGPWESEPRKRDGYPGQVIEHGVARRPRIGSRTCSCPGAVLETAAPGNAWVHIAECEKCGGGRFDEPQTPPEQRAGLETECYLSSGFGLTWAGHPLRPMPPVGTQFVSRSEAEAAIAAKDAEIAALEKRLSMAHAAENHAWAEEKRERKRAEKAEAAHRCG